MRSEEIGNLPLAERVVLEDHELYVYYALEPGFCHVIRTTDGQIRKLLPRTKVLVLADGEYWDGDLFRTQVNGADEGGYPEEAGPSPRAVAIQNLSHLVAMSDANDDLVTKIAAKVVDSITDVVLDAVERLED